MLKKTPCFSSKSIQNLPGDWSGRKRTGHRFFLMIFILFICGHGFAQLPPGVYQAGTVGEQQQLKVAGNYLVYTDYGVSPPAFHKTMGGFYTVQDGMLNWQLEFNSNFEQDSLRTQNLPLKVKGNEILWGPDELVFDRLPENDQALDGLWLFATRGPDTGQERRGESSSRKTLKFLLDGQFQWIAYDTGSMRFSGTGGGHYTAEDGTYTEHIEYFSRDNGRVGASLEFSYDLQGDDWHHTGNNSRGEPMYEIWARRKINGK